MNIKLHTKIKHRILAYYFAVLKNVIKGFYYWYYVDLYAGDGICNCDGIPEHVLLMLPKASDKTYPPPFFSLLSFANENDFDKLNMRFIFNDMYSIDKLKKRLPKSDCIIGIGSKDANIYCQDAIDLIEKPERPSLFYLDPTNHKDLKFSTIKRISEFKSERNGRKPELIINLMVFTLLEAVKRKDYDTITESLGTDSFKQELKKFQSINKTHELFLKTFKKQLSKLGYQTTHYLVSSTEKRAPMYYLIFCAHNENIYSIHKNIELNIKKLQNEDWVKETATIAYKIDKLPQDQKTLGSY